MILQILFTKIEKYQLRASATLESRQAFCPFLTHFYPHRPEAFCQNFSIFIRIKIRHFGGLSGVLVELQEVWEPHLQKMSTRPNTVKNGLGMQRISTIIVIFRYHSFIKLLLIISVNPRTAKSTTRTCNHPAEEVSPLLYQNPIQTMTSFGPQLSFFYILSCFFQLIQFVGCKHSVKTGQKRAC